MPNKNTISQETINLRNNILQKLSYDEDRDSRYLANHLEVSINRLSYNIDYLVTNGLIQQTVIGQRKFTYRKLKDEYIPENRAVFDSNEHKPAHARLVALTDKYHFERMPKKNEVWTGSQLGSMIF